VTFLPGKSLSLGIGGDEGPLKYAIKHYSIPPPGDPKECIVVFSLEDRSWAPFASLSAIYDKSQSIDAGYAVEVWRPTHFMHALKYPGPNQPVNQPIDRIFTGISVDISIRDTDAEILKLGYHITLLGRIAFAATGSIQD
jgi:hypothetical protein